MTRSNKILERQFYGEEPVYKGTPTEVQVSKALSWYNYMVDEDRGRAWLGEYLKTAGYDRENIKLLKESKNISLTDCWLARMMLNGTTLPAGYVQRLQDRLNAQIKALTKPVDQPVAKLTTTLQERVKKATWNIITDIEEQLDRDPTFSLHAFLTQANASAVAVEAVRKYYIPHLEEVNSKDPQVAEAYGSRLKFWKKIYTGMIVDCDKLLENKKALPKTRKPRKLKVKSPADLVKKVKYLAKDTSLNVSSIDPQKIIGATQLWVFNTKYRMLGVYNTSSTKGFSVKGTTILNFDPEKSVARKLRKPQEQLKAFASQGKVGLRTFLTNIKAKDSKLTGRINGDTILLKVF